MREKQIKGKLATDWNCIRCSFSTLLISFCAEHLIGFCSRFFFLVSFSLWTTCCLRRNKRSKPERRSRRTLSFSITSLFSLFLFVFIEIVLLFTFSWLFLFNDFSIVLRLLRQTVSIADFWKKLHTAARLPDYITDFGNVPKWFMRIRGDISSVVGRTSHLHIVCCLLKKKKRKNAWIYIGHQGPVNGKLYVIDLSGGWCGSIDGMQISIRVEGNRKQLKWPPSPNVDLQTCPLLTLMMDQS